MFDAPDVKAIRQARGWTQQQLAEACGVDRATVSRWEAEPPTKGPAFILLRQLALGSGEGSEARTVKLDPNVDAQQATEAAE